MSEAWTAEHGTLSLWKGVVGPRVDTRTLRQIAEDVAANHGLTLEEMKAPTSARRISHPRQEAMAAMRATGRYSLSQIGGFFGLHHSSALHGARAHEARVAKWRGFGNAIVPQVAAEVIGAFMDYEQDQADQELFA